MTIPGRCNLRQFNDRTDMQAYGFGGKLNTESECVAELMNMYQEMTKG